MKTKDILISDFTNELFQTAFKQYFAELDVSVRDWGGLFQEMNHEEENRAYIRMTEAGDVVGFIMFTPITLKNWFFDIPMGFVREFWVPEQYRRGGHGSALLKLAEDYFVDHGTYKSILTTDTAENFYLHRGYKKDADVQAKNQDMVFVKSLRG